MKLKEGVIISEIDNEYIAVAAGKAARYFNGMIRMNETTAFILELLKKESTTESIAFSLCEEYDVSFETALKNVSEVVSVVCQAGLTDGD